MRLRKWLEMDIKRAKDLAKKEWIQKMTFGGIINTIRRMNRITGYTEHTPRYCKNTRRNYQRTN